MQKARAIQQLDEIVNAISEIMLVFEEASSGSDNVIEVRGDQLGQLITAIQEEAHRKDQLANEIPQEDLQITRKYRDCTQDLISASKSIQNIVKKSLTVQRKDYDSLHSSLKKILQALVSQFQLIDALNVRTLFRLCKKKYYMLIRIKNLKNESGVVALKEENENLDIQWNEFLNGRLEQTTDPEWTSILTTARNDMQKNFPICFQVLKSKINSPTVSNVEKFDNILYELLRNLSDILYIVQKSAEYIQQFGIMMDLPPLMDKASGKSFGPLPEVENSLVQMEKAVLNKDPKSATENLKKFMVVAGKQVEQGRGLAEMSNDPNTRREILKGVQGLLGVQPELLSATKRWATNPNDEQAKRKLLEQIELAKQYNNLIEEQKPQNASLARHGELKNAIAQLRNQTSAQKLNPQEIQKQVKLVGEKIQNQVAYARNAAQNIDDPVLRKKINDAADELERLRPQIEQATKKVLENPNDKQARNRLNELLDRADKLNNTITEAILEDQLRKNGQDLENAMNNLQNAVRSGDKERVEQALQEAERLLRDRIDLARKYAQITDDVMLKKELNEQADKLEKQLQQLRPKVMNAFNNPKDKRAQKELEDLLSDIRNNARRVDPNVAQEFSEKTTTSKRIKEQGKNLENDFDEFMKNVKKGDAKGAVQVAKRIASGLYDQAALGRRLADEINDPVLKKKVLDAAKRLEELPPEIAAAIRELLKDPNNPEKLKKLESLIDEARRHNKTITDAAAEVEKRKNQPPPPNPRPQNNNSEMFNGKQDKVMVAANKVQNFVKEAPTPVIPEEKKLLDISNDIGKEMEKLALFARQGNKTEMIATARKIASMIQQIQKLTNEISSKCTNPLLKQQLLQISNAPQNFAVQLKIICAVKDRTSNDDKSAGAQLVTCAQGLANSVTQTISAAHAASLKCPK